MAKIRNRVGRAVVAAGAALAMAVILGGAAPAHAVATSVRISHSISIPGLVKHDIRVRVFMSSATQAEAQRYIDTGSTITIRCFGDDPIQNDLLPNVPISNLGLATYSGTQLRASSLGFISLTVTSLYDLGRGLNEDFEGTDEIFCAAEFRGSDGILLNHETDVVSGNF